MKIYEWLFFIIILIIINSCSGELERPEVSFYHWKSYYGVSEEENDYLEQLRVKKLYLRYFDVDFVNGEPGPIGKIVIKNDFKYGHEIIPTVFITNRVFENIGIHKMDDLIFKINKLINSTHKKISGQLINEIQFDCDWTDGTREKYFLFLREMNKKGNWDISVTIRLHQVKYRERTGVPPADKFVLMCYNTGEVKDISEVNSILNPEVVRQYTSGMSDYPHRLELALPLFSWGVLFRDGELIKLIRNIDASAFSDDKKYELEGNRVRVLEGTYLNGYYLYGGDVMRLEGITGEVLELTGKILGEYLSPGEIIYYHLDGEIIKRMDHEVLESINDLFIGG